ncbi:MAG: PD-(D/E)XK nuclease family protein [Metallosphaera sp.]
MVVKEIIYQHIVDDEFKQPYEGEYWPSQIWNCLRKQYYDRTSPVLSGIDSARFTVLGEALHDLVAEILKKEDSVKVTSELPLRIPHPTNHEIVISGRADDLIVIEFTKERYLVEVKSVDNLQHKVRNGYLPRLEHRAQLNLYMKAFPKSKGVLLYVDRSNFEMEEFILDFDEQLYLKTMERAELLHRAIKERKVPEPEAKLRDDMRWQCDFCLYRAKCDKDS